MSSGFENLFLAKPLGPLGHSASSLNVPFSCAQGDGGEGTPEKFGNFSSLGTTICGSKERLSFPGASRCSPQVQPQPIRVPSSRAEVPPPTETRARGGARARTHTESPPTLHTEADRLGPAFKELTDSTTLGEIGKGH